MYLDLGLLVKARPNNAMEPTARDPRAMEKTFADTCPYGRLPGPRLIAKPLARRRTGAKLAI